jgi:hypothetical protein
MTGFIRATKNIETLQSDDIANAILYEYKRQIMLMPMRY